MSNEGAVTTLREFLAARQINQDAAAVLAGVDGSTISKIIKGRNRATPATIVKLAIALHISASRMQRLCEQHWLDAHDNERVPDRDTWVPVS